MKRCTKPASSNVYIDEQQCILAELRRQREEEEQRQAAEKAAALERPKRPRARRKKGAE